MIVLRHFSKVSTLDEIELKFVDLTIITCYTIGSKDFEVIARIKFEYLKKGLKACEMALLTMISIYAVHMVLQVKGLVSAVLLSEVVNKRRHYKSSGSHLLNLNL